MTAKAIDVWDLDTFDAELCEALRRHEAALVNYFKTKRSNFLAREASDHRGAPPSNRHAGRYYELADDFAVLMNERTIRGWHYSRMVDDEASAVASDGFRPSTLETLKLRLGRLVDRRILEPHEAAVLHDASPFHRDQFGGRSGKFWMVSHPHAVDDSGVTSLLAHWGGESAYFDHPRGPMLDRLSGIGRPRVFEVAAPLTATPDAYAAAKAVIRRYVRALGVRADWGGFDFYAERPLGPEAVLRIHTEGDPTFRELGLSYPVGFQDRYGAFDADD